MKLSCMRALPMSLYCSLAILFVCTTPTDITNPYLNSYSGDYALDAAWVNRPDSFLVLIPYQVNYANTGKDSFLSYAVATDPAGCVDTSFFRKSLTDSQMTIVFTSPMNGTLKIIGIHPNFKQTDFSLPVTVVNPFKITGTREVLSGQSITLTIAATQNTAHTARWFLGNELVQTKIAGHAFSIARDTAVSHSVFALISDTLGNTVSTDTIMATFKPRVPAAKFIIDSIQIPVGQETTLAIQATDCDSVRWVSVGAGLNITTTGNLKTTFAAAGNYTIIATGISRFGIVGLPDTLHATALHFNYTLNLIPPPKTADTMAVRKWKQWEAQAMRNGSAVSGADVVYEWNITPDSLWDSLKTSSDGRQLRLFVKDSLAPFSLGVRAKIGATDSTAIQNLIVVVRTYRPGCTFVSGEFAGQINQPITLTLKAKDSNIDGAIAGIYFSTSDNPTMVSTAGADTFSVTFLTPGPQKVVHAIAVDNDGFVSDTAHLYGTITANKPYFLQPTVDITAFIHAEVSIIAQADAGNTGDSIAQYQWDFNNDGVWDLTSTKNRFDTAFTDAGVREIKVSCKNQRGDSTATYMTVKITVLDGAPTVKSVQCNPMLSYIGDPVDITITASDTNGTVTAVAIKVNGGADTVFEVRAEESIDTAIELTFDTPGKYHIAVAAIDNHGKKSDYVAIGDSLIVSSGNPVVKGIKPDSAWIYDTITYMISASDVNGTVESWFVAWDGSVSFVQYADSTAEHRYTTAGMKPIRIYVTDNDGLSSDTLTDSVMIKLGKPTALPVFPDSVYIYESVQYKLRGTDPNGTIRQWGIQWESGLPFETRIDSIFTHTYTGDSLRTVRCYVVDNDGILSDTMTVSVYVKLGLPQITAIATSQPTGAIYVRDTIEYKIKGRDENGYVDSIFASWNGDTLFEAKFKAVGDSALFTYSFARGDSGARKVRFRVKDIDGMVRDSVFTVNVRSGAPIIDSISPDTVWVRDSVQYWVHARDLNGVLDSFRISFDLGATWKAADSAKFKHAWDTTKAGVQEVLARVMDDDSVWTSDTFDVVVRLGRPCVWILGDTLFVPTPDGGGYVNIAVQSLDTNGTIQKYYWDFNAPYDTNIIAGDKRTDSTYSYNVQFVDMPFKMAVFGKDDDGLMAGDTFWLYPDGPPPTPTLVAPTGGDDFFSNASIVTLEWTIIDKRDSLNTKYQIYIDPPGAGTPEAPILPDFRAGNTFTVTMVGNVPHFKYSFTETTTAGTYIWKVAAKDQLGRVETSATETFIINP